MITGRLVREPRLAMSRQPTGQKLPGHERDEMDERWRDIPGYDGRYRVSDQGHVAYRRAGGWRAMSPKRNEWGYILYGLRKDGKRRFRRAHALVAEAFIGPRPEGMPIRHLDGNPANNHVTNLTYGTVSENVFDSVRHGTHSMVRKTHYPSGHPYSGANLKVSAAGHRHCRTCRRELDRRRDKNRQRRRRRADAKPAAKSHRSTT